MAEMKAEDNREKVSGPDSKPIYLPNLISAAALL